MKNVILTALTLAAFATSATAFAGNKTTKKMISPDEYIEEVSEFLGDWGNSNGKAEFVGELSDIGGECKVYFEADEEGRMVAVMESEKGFKINALVFADDKVKVREISSEDGSFERTYTYGIGGLHQLTLVHVDDAYETIILKSGSTSARCAIEY